MSTKPMYYVNPPKACDMCNRRLTGKFIDGATQLGPWANMCPPCHREQGRGLGEGKGQEYTKQPDDKWLKTRG